MRPAAWLLLVVPAFACGPKTGSNNPKTTPLTAKEIADRSSPAIVRIEVAEGNNRGIGTGFILEKSGLIATNLHVIVGTDDIKVKTHDGAVYRVTEIAGFDPDRDLALVRIVAPAKPLPILKLGDSDKMSAGEQIVAIGNPLGHDYTVSAGLVSKIQPECTDEDVALHNANLARFEELKAKYIARTLTEAEVPELLKLRCSAELRYIQISAPISQGSSGGPVFNVQGEVVGVTQAIVKDGQNLNYAVPVNYLKPIIAKPVAISVAEFAQQTRGPTTATNEEPVKREIPDHALVVLDGCKREQVGELVRSIWDAIAVGAPIYNKASQASTDEERQRYFEACYRIYEGTATKYEQTPPCKGVHEAFADGLARAKGMSSYKLKAWAMRDTFDGLLNLAKKYADANPGPPLEPQKK